MNEKIIKYLKSRKKKTIALWEIMKLFPGNVSYEKFAENTKKLEVNNVLIPIKSHGKNNKKISLYNTYRINKGYFRQQLIDRIQSYKLKFNINMDLSYYLSSNEKEWEQDVEYIKKIDSYLKSRGFPEKEALSQERSYEIIGDEKWIDEKGGRRVIERLNILDKLKISCKNDPLMFAVNPSQFQNKIYKHMIVENKATFHLFLDLLNETDFTSLIYGSGWKVVSNIVMLKKQLSLKNGEHKLYYFGDLDYEGLSIWNGLNDRNSTCLAVDFYRALLKKKPSKGKENQRVNRNSLNKFTEHFTDDEKLKIEELLKDKFYYPQEALGKNEVEKIWRNI